MAFLKRTLQRVWAAGNIEPVQTAGAFTTNGTSDPTVFFGRSIASVTYVSAGLWTVTLNWGLGANIIAKIVSMDGNASEDIKVNIVDGSVTSTTFQVQALAVATQTNPASSIVVSFLIWSSKGPLK